MAETVNSAINWVLLLQVCLLTLIITWEYRWANRADAAIMRALQRRRAARHRATIQARSDTWWCLDERQSGDYSERLMLETIPSMDLAEIDTEPIEWLVGECNRIDYANKHLRRRLLIAEARRGADAPDGAPQAPA